MRAVILYHPQSDHIGLVTEYVHDFERFKGRKLEMVSLETREGADLAKLYDITSYPAILAIEADGRLAQVWQNGLLPLMDDLFGVLGPTEEPVSREGRKIIFPGSSAGLPHPA